MVLKKVIGILFLLIIGIVLYQEIDRFLLLATDYYDLTDDTTMVFYYVERSMTFFITICSGILVLKILVLQNDKRFSIYFGAILFCLAVYVVAQHIREDMVGRIFLVLIATLVLNFVGMMLYIVREVANKIGITILLSIFVILYSISIVTGKLYYFDYYNQVLEYGLSDIIVTLFDSSIARWILNIALSIVVLESLIFEKEEVKEVYTSEKTWEEER